MLTWSDLATRTLSRQFAPSTSPIAATVAAIGPIQSQVARSVFTGLAARRPGTTYDEIETAYETVEILRGTSLRGTVHTVAAGDHPVLDAVTRQASAKLWRRTLGVEPSAAQEELESYAREWRTPARLREHLSAWLATHGGRELSDTLGRSLAHGHSGLVRRPVARTGWDRQTPPEYCAVTALSPGRTLPEFDDALGLLCELHVRSHGPSAAADIAWWSGVNRTTITSRLARMSDAGQLVASQGPGDQILFDTPIVRSDGSDPGTRLLPEFDALVCAYAPQNRTRFVDESAREHYWTSANGMYSSVLLHDGRVRGSWKLTSSGKRRRVDVRMFPGEPMLGRGDLAASVSALEDALAARIFDVVIASSH